MRVPVLGSAPIIRDRIELVNIFGVDYFGNPRAAHLANELLFQALVFRGIDSIVFSAKLKKVICGGAVNLQDQAAYSAGSVH